MSSKLFNKLYPAAITNVALGSTITTSTTVSGPGASSLPIDTTGGAITITLAGFVAGDRIEFVDRSNTDVGAAMPNGLTLDPGATATIDGLTQADLSSDPLIEGFSAFAVEFDGANYEVVTR